MLVCGQTEKAYKVKIDNENKWLPKSQCWVEGQILHIKSWLADKNGFPEKYKLTDAEYVDYFGGVLEKKTPDLDQSDLAYISTIFKPNEKQEEALFKSNLADGFFYALKQGVGKTKLCLDEIALLDKKGAIDTVIIVTPNGLLKKGWIKQIKEHFLRQDEYCYMVWEALDKPKIQKQKQADFFNSEKKKFLIINYESIRAKKGNAFLAQVIDQSEKGVFCCLDEVHKILNRKSKIGEWFRENRNLFRYRRGMSGTGIKKHASDIWNIMKFLVWPSLQDTYWKFAEEYFYIDKDGYGWDVKGFKKGKKEEYLERIDPYYVYGELDNSVAMPDKLISVDMTNVAVARSIDYMREILTDTLGHGFKDDEIEENAEAYEYSEFKRLSDYCYKYKADIYQQDRAYLTRMRQLAGCILGNREQYQVLTENESFLEIPKVQRMLQELEDTDLDEDKIIIAGTQIPLLLEAKKALENAGYKLSYIDGSITGDERDLELLNFENQKNILLVNYKTISTGLNLQYANRMMFLDIDFQADELDQARKRIDRQGQQKPCYYTFLLAEDSIDWAIYSSNQAKLKVQKSVLGVQS